MMKKFSINSTPIIVGEHAVSEIHNFLKKEVFTHIFILVDANTKKYCLKHLLDESPILKNSRIIELPIGESAKSIKVFQKTCLELISYDIDRNSLIINLGGGVISDFGGFLSGVLKRGVKFINIPTTLMAQIDASIGGKVALNLNDYKNQIGLFLQPILILIDPSYLSSLSDQDFSSAKAEVLKYGLIYQKSFWNKLVSMNFNKKKDLNYIVQKCVSIKVQIVNSDYYDWNQRRKLNFGHSIAHAIESVYFRNKQSLSHGFSLCIGLICESYISYKKYNFPKIEFDSIIKEIKKVFTPIDLDSSYDDLILNYIKADKKNSNRIYNFTLINSIGSSIINCSVSDEEILLSLNFYRQNVKIITK